MKCQYCGSPDHQTDDYSEYCITYLKHKISDKDEVIDSMMKEIDGIQQTYRVCSNLEVIKRIQQEGMHLIIQLIHQLLGVHPEYPDSFPMTLTYMRHAPSLIMHLKKLINEGKVKNEELEKLMGAFM